MCIRDRLSGEEQAEHAANACGGEWYSSVFRGGFQSVAECIRGRRESVMEARCLHQFQHRQARGHRNRIAAERALSLIHI